MTITRRMALSLALGSLLAFALASVALATHPRPGGGTPFRVPFVPAFKQCTSPNTTHTAPLALPSCTPPAMQSTLLTQGTTGGGTGFGKLDVFCNGGAPGESPPCATTAGDQEDIRVTATIQDVRCVGVSSGCTAAGVDYTGQLVGNSDIRITDHSNPVVCTNGAGTGCTTATVTDTNFAVPASCVANATANGSTCSLATTIDTVVPNTVKETQRGVVSIFSLNAKDIGPDGSITPVGAPLPCPPICGTGDEQKFQDQGIFLP
jgi:hypothetical protein